MFLLHYFSYKNANYVVRLIKRKKKTISLQVVLNGIFKTVQHWLSFSSKQFRCRARKRCCTSCQSAKLEKREEKR